MFEPGSNESVMLEDYFKFLKKYSVIRDDDQYWMSFLDDANSLTKKYNDNLFLRDLLLAWNNELERQIKAR